MTTPGSSPKKSGWLANFSAALAPMPITEDEHPDQPLKAPRGVLFATVLSILAGLLFLWMTIGTFTNIESQIAVAVSQYNADIDKCEAEVGGIGDAVVAAPSEELKATAEACRKLAPLTDEMIDGAKQRVKMFASVLGAVGLAALVAGWFLRSGAKWARRVLIAAVAVAMVMTMVLQFANVITMIASLGLVVAVMLCYLGSGGNFFQLAAIRRKNARKA